MKVDEGLVTKKLQELVNLKGARIREKQTCQ